MWLLFSITSHYFGLDMMGVLALAAAVSAPILLLAGMSPRQTMVTKVIEDFNYFNIARVITLSIVYVFTGLISFFFVEQKYYVTFLLFLLFKFVETYYDFEYSLHLINKNFNKICKSMLYRSMQLVVFVFFSITTNSLIISIVAMVVYNLILITITCRPAGFKFIKLALVYEMFTKTKLISISSFLTLLFLNTPRYFLSNDGLTGLAIFSGLMNFVTVLRMLMQSYLNVVLQYLREMYVQDEKKSYVRLLMKPMYISTILCGVSLLFYIVSGNKLFKMVYGDSFNVDSSTVYAAIFFSLFLSFAMILNTALTSLSEFNFQFKISTVLTVLSFVLSYIFITNMRLDVLGAFIVLCISCILQSILIVIAIIQSRRKTKND